MDVGAALTGRRADIEDRRDTQWPEYDLPNQPKFLPVSPTQKTEQERLENVLNLLDPSRVAGATRLGVDAGIHDIGPLPKEEVLKFILGHPSINYGDEGPLLQHNERLKKIGE